MSTAREDLLEKMVAANSMTEIMLLQLQINLLSKSDQ